MIFAEGHIMNNLFVAIVPRYALVTRRTVMWTSVSVCWFYKVEATVTVYYHTYVAVCVVTHSGMKPWGGHYPPLAKKAKFWPGPLTAAFPEGLYFEIFTYALPYHGIEHFYSKDGLPVNNVVIKIVLLAGFQHICWSQEVQFLKMQCKWYHANKDRNFKQSPQKTNKLYAPVKKTMICCFR